MTEKKTTSDSDTERGGRKERETERERLYFGAGYIATQRCVRSKLRSTRMVYLRNIQTALEHMDVDRHCRAVLRENDLITVVVKKNIVSVDTREKTMSFNVASSRGRSFARL